MIYFCIVVPSFPFHFLFFFFFERGLDSLVCNISLLHPHPIVLPKS